ncbi:MAG: hypothetical protein AW06_004250 [Candidatus Accumulibacter cognatus]|uniref:Uncharacterized protein n=1 Tax=Candidatus Accumulibacter cognatus TaxID=2954383 RepID=A0A080MCA3_9PROT|nr:MAG: hypothetical protein AW06_004250 [Candidatus Accumulibacter cognatus]
MTNIGAGTLDDPLSDIGRFPGGSRVRRRPVFIEQAIDLIQIEDVEDLKQWQEALFVVALGEWFAVGLLDLP